MRNVSQRIRHPSVRIASDATSRPRRRTALQPVAEVLEDRQLLTASLAAIANLSVPAQQGYTLPLDGSGTTDAQNFTITQTSGSPDITASIAQGTFWTINVTYTDPTNSANDFSGPLTFQLFSGLTPNTVNMIQEFTNDGYYNGKQLTRVATGFPGATDFVVQGGAPNPDGTGSSGQPGTPFANESLQQLAFTGTDQLGMANAGGTDSNDTQFFITTGSPDAELGYNYTIFGQLVAGASTLAKITQVPVQTNPALDFEDSMPVNPLIMSSVSLSSTNPNGTAIIDTTQATPGETATFQVTATDPADGSSVSQSFIVTVGAYAGPTTPTINFKPFATPVTASVSDGSSTTIALPGQSGDPSTSEPTTLTFSLVSQPVHGTISEFDAATGTFVYTPQPGFTGTDSLQFLVQSGGPPGSLLTPTTSNPATVTIAVRPTPTPLVTLNDVTYATNRQHHVTKIFLTFSGTLDATEADETASYHLSTPGKHGSFSAKHARTIKLKASTYDDLETVTLVPRKPFALGMKVEVVVYGTGPSALHDSLGRLIDGDHDGVAGGNAVAILSKK